MTPASINTSEQLPSCWLTHTNSNNNRDGHFNRHVIQVMLQSQPHQQHPVTSTTLVYTTQPWTQILTQLSNITQHNTTNTANSIHVQQQHPASCLDHIIYTVRYDRLRMVLLMILIMLTEMLTTVMILLMLMMGIQTGMSWYVWLCRHGECTTHTSSVAHHHRHTLSIIGLTPPHTAYNTYYLSCQRH